MRGRKPTPSFLKLISGNPGKRWLRKAAGAPPAAAMEAPACLGGDGLEEWQRVAPGLSALHVVSPLDRAVLTAYCTAFDRWRQAERAIAEMAKCDLLTAGLMIRTSNGNAIQNPLVGTANVAMRDMLRFAAELGLTPIARARLDVNAPPGTNKFDGLIGGAPPRDRL